MSQVEHAALLVLERSAVLELRASGEVLRIEGFALPRARPRVAEERDVADVDQRRQVESGVGDDHHALHGGVHAGH